MIAASPSRPARWVAGRLAALLLAGLVLAELTDNVVDHDGLTAPDRPWHEWVVTHRSAGLTQLMSALSTIGSTVVLAALALCVAAWLALRRRWPRALQVVLTAGGAALLVALVKHLVTRPRPPAADRLMVETSWSYPSGHSLGAAAVLGVLTIVVVARLRRRAARAVAVAVGVLLVAAIGVSRIYLGVHWPSDVLAGWLFGGLWLAICHALALRYPGPNRVLPNLDTTDHE